MALGVLTWPRGALVLAVCLLVPVEDDHRYEAHEEELSEEDADDEDDARAAQDGD